MLCITALVPMSLTKTALQNINCSDIFDGQILFSPINSNQTYLINKTGAVNHNWSSNYRPRLSVYMLDDGSLLRTADLGWGNDFGGGIERFIFDGTLVWHFEYASSDNYQIHHDIEYLPNGNVLALAFELKTPDEVINAGRDPDLTPPEYVEFEFIIEVQPTGPTTGNIVWEWHFWDHLIQDYDKEKTNFGDVAGHPELIDINFGGAQTDWLHCNSIEYNEKFDQIAISSRYLGEIYIIDHSTTTIEARGHSGGNSGKGGDILYRWGNPKSYRAGTTADQKLFGQHDPTWIKPGYPGEGHILVFNNGLGRGYSSVDEIVPPVDAYGHYYHEPGTAYGPKKPIWSYTADPPTSFYASYISGAQRLPNGNTLICDGPAGRLFEVTPEKTIIWQYINPYPSITKNQVFKIQYIPPEEQVQPIPDIDGIGCLTWDNVKAGETMYDSFQLQNIGDPFSLLNWTINSSSLNWGTWTFTPDSGEQLTPEDGIVTINVSVVAPNKKNTQFEGYLRVENQDNSTDFDLIPVYLKTHRNTPIALFLRNNFWFTQILQKIFVLLK